jgi:hypothetical protein
MIKTTGDCAIFQLSSVPTNNARWTCGFKLVISMAKAALKNKKIFFSIKFYLNLRKKQTKSYIWSRAFTVPKLGEFGYSVGSSWEVLKLGAVESSRSSFGHVV